MEVLCKENVAFLLRGIISQNNMSDAEIQLSVSVRRRVKRETTYYSLATATFYIYI
jgi:hypothetical protein